MARSTNDKPDAFWDDDEPLIGYHETGNYQYAWKSSTGWHVGREAPEGVNIKKEEGIEHISEFLAGAQDQYEDLSEFSEGMLLADQIANETNITRNQAEAYVCREILGWSRETVANVFKVSASNVDELVRRAKRKIAEARTLVELINVNAVEESGDE